MSNEIFIKILLSIIGFVGALGVKALISIANSVNEIKINIKEIATKHDALERRVEHLEKENY
jgi:hypothetical protein